MIGEPINKTLTVSSLSQGSKEVPFIRMRGQWLSALGFSIGDQIEVTSNEKGQLTITRKVHYKELPSGAEYITEHR
jgi:hypothetical protein